MSVTAPHGRVQVGDRVVAISHTEEDTNSVKIFGFGVYEGDHIPPPKTPGIWGDIIGTNPRIKLDSGEIVWGAQCWWGAESRLDPYKKDGWTIDVIKTVEVFDRKNRPPPI